jgi:hypothetical protein
MNEALLFIGSGTPFCQATIGTIGRTPFTIMNQQIHASVHRPAIHSPPPQTEGDGCGMAHFDIFGTLYFHHTQFFHHTLHLKNLEAFEKCSILFKVKEGEDFNHRNTR